MSLEVTRRTVCAALVGGMAALILGAVPADQADNPAGTWKMVSSSGSGDVDWTLVITEPDGKYSATANTGDGAAPVSNLKVDGKSVQFSVNYQGAGYDIDLHVKGDAMTGTWSGADSSGETRGQRATAAP